MSTIPAAPKAANASYRFMALMGRNKLNVQRNKEQNKIRVKSRDRKLIISYNVKNKLKSENERKPRMINVNFVNRTPQMSNFELVL